MGRLQHHHRSRSASSFARSSSSATAADLDARSVGSSSAPAEPVDCPFGAVDGLGRAELREAAYEVFFMSCRAAPRGGGLGYYPAGVEGSGGGGVDAWSPTIGAGPRGGTGMNVVSSRVKRTLGLRARRSAQPTTVRSSSLNPSSSAPGSPGRVRAVREQQAAPGSPGRPRRPMTSAEIMRQQMRVTEQSDARLRKTLMRTLVGQVGKKADTIILPLELLRQLKLTDFADSGEHHQWQRRQFKLLEAGLILHPSLPLDRLTAPVLRFQEIKQAADARAIDTGKASDTMRALCDAVLALAWRSAPGTTGQPGESCHWADGYPLNVLLYVSLLQAIFDRRDDTVVLDEVDELLELMKRAWPTLGVDKTVHDVCLAWVLFQQYVATGQVQPDLAGAALTMLLEVAADAAKEQDPVYLRVLSSAVAAIHDWSEKRLLDYHEWYGKRVAGMGAEAMESAVSLALSTAKIIAENLPGMGIINSADINGSDGMEDFVGGRVDYYVRCSVKSAFTKMLENELGQGSRTIVHRDEEPSVILARLAKDTEQLARSAASAPAERWHPFPFPGAAAAAHPPRLLRRRAQAVPGQGHLLTNELVHVLTPRAGSRSALLAEGGEDDGGERRGEGGGPLDVETGGARFLKTWIEERLRASQRSA
ncbi:hypothetical protein PR202_ga27125 [Eleusine coracana subsp. coracana]|uniref:MHD1 domain-containing protein n=1 Tax=Eleusine coracana subsp. coracana TaxID=191504 RepID=A0AAV5DGT2_ELECO|nr:hypothetical protein PR202_ga27125 [Eleusine coracana subsp. coracana]